MQNKIKNDFWLKKKENENKLKFKMYAHSIKQEKYDPLKLKKRCEFLMLNRSNKIFGI